jgi:hypothetical protein
MQIANKIDSGNLDRHEQHLMIFTCAFLAILAAGAALLMYPVVFSHQTPDPDRTLRYAFLGFCCLCALLIFYIWETQKTIRSLRRQMAADRRRIAEAGRQASEELLKTIPKLNSFQDLLPMEYRRTIAASEHLSVLVITVQSPGESSNATEGTSILGDAAKAIARKLRSQDSIYLLGRNSFGAVLPTVELQAAKGISARVGEGLSDAAGVSNRFTWKIDIVNYPEHASSAHELQQAVRGLIPADYSVHGLADESPVLR